MLHKHQNGIHILSKPGPELYIADWLSCHKHGENKDQEISGMHIHTINATVDMPIYMSIKDTKTAIEKYVELEMLKDI